jgi:tetratricopeptide (TPR) repeat protein
MKSAVKYSLVVISILLSSASFAQFEKLNRVMDCIKAKDVNCAKNAVDSAFMSPEVRQDAQAWYYRAFVYYELAKKDKFNINSAYRDTSLNAIKVSYSLKPEPNVIDANKAIIKKHAETYYNMCIRYLYDSLNYDRSSSAYKKYKEHYSSVDSTFDFRSKDIEYYSAVGSHFSDLFNNNNTKTEYGEAGKLALMKVIELDPKNVSANINLGIIYYNQGVNLINSMDIDTPLDKLEVIQDNSTKLFKQSLPFMSKVYQLDPKNVKALESLRQIYQALNDTEKSLEFNKKLEEAKKAQ